MNGLGSGCDCTGEALRADKARGGGGDGGGEHATGGRGEDRGDSDLARDAEGALADRFNTGGTGFAIDSPENLGVEGELGEELDGEFAVFGKDEDGQGCAVGDGAEIDENFSFREVGGGCNGDDVILGHGGGVGEVERGEDRWGG